MDLSLACRLRARDQLAMTEVYDLYGAMVFRVVLRNVANETLAEDLTQETFLRVWNGAHGFDETRGTLGGWIAAVARNTAIDYLRSPAARAVRTSVELDEAGMRRHSAFDDWVGDLDRARLVRRAFEKLSESQRAVLNLAFVEGMSHAEIARSLNRPLGTVKTWMRSGLQMLAAQPEFGRAQ
jgi:RNA polymerase sigma-70 factor (ECF subfamily)